MADDRLREAERRYGATGSRDDGILLAKELKRSGQLPRYVEDFEAFYMFDPDNCYAKGLMDEHNRFFLEISPLDNPSAMRFHNVLVKKDGDTSGPRTFDVGLEQTAEDPLRDIASREQGYRTMSSHEVYMIAHALRGAEDRGVVRKELIDQAKQMLVSDLEKGILSCSQAMYNPQGNDQVFHAYLTQHAWAVDGVLWGEPGVVSPRDVAFKPIFYVQDQEPWEEVFGWLAKTQGVIVERRIQPPSTAQIYSIILTTARDHLYVGMSPFGGTDVFRPIKVVGEEGGSFIDVLARYAGARSD